MNDKKFDIIVYSASGNFSFDAVKALGKLSAPEGYSLKILPVTGEKYRAYDSAMNDSDAKYKIYLDERAVILNENILSDILKIFQSDEKIGVIGTSGAVELSTHGVALNSAKRCGKISMNDWSGVEENFREVDAVDSWFLATQYDFPWRHDIFSDNYFGETAQCIEFKRRGYKCVVANQSKPWLALQSTNFQIDEQSRIKFLEEYSSDIFPLVSVIIPTFNRPKYFKEALESALNQTYRHFEIVISDDGTNNETENLIQPYLEKYPRIKYFRNKGFTSHDNWNFLRAYNNPDAEYVNWLMDDDLWYPRKLEIMVEVYRNNPDVSLVTSAKNIIDADGNVTGSTQNFAAQNLKLTGDEAARYLFAIDNYIGEPTTVLIRKKFLRDNDLCWNEDETGFFSLVDVSTWCQLLTQGNLFRCVEKLSALRSYDGQSGCLIYTGALFSINYVKLFKTALDRKVFFHTDEQIRAAMIFLFQYCLRNLNKA